jgi:hypothetical protein
MPCCEMSHGNVAMDRKTCNTAKCLDWYHTVLVCHLTSARPVVSQYKGRIFIEDFIHGNGKSRIWNSYLPYECNGVMNLWTF